jgi:thiosulfate dehydrogenase (quinone) large subunit
MSLADNFKQSTYLGYLAILRIFVGYHFLNSAWNKLTRDHFLQGHSLSTRLLGPVANDPNAWHQAFINGFVLQHSLFFSYLIPLGEVAIGISFVLGCMVRLSSPFAAFLNLNILFAIAIPGGGAQVGLNRIFIVLDLMFFFSSAGRSLGLDAILKKWFPRSWLF